MGLPLCVVPAVEDMYLPHRSACEWDTTREDLVRNFDRSSQLRSSVNA